MKKAMSLALAALMLMGTLTGCGSSNSNKVAVLEEGMKYTPISISPNEAQFLETRKFQIDEIARIFRVPPHMVGDLEKSSFSNIEQQWPYSKSLSRKPRAKKPMTKLLMKYSGFENSARRLPSTLLQ